jgi:hypothetical protein
VIDLPLTLAGLFVGFVVGLTGMGGGALMTPLLVLGFGVQPLTAVSSDLVASVFMKPIGGTVHLRRGNVSKELVLWLVLGSVPAAFAGVVLLRHFTASGEIQDVVRVALGYALLVAASAIVAKEALQKSRGAVTGGSSLPAAGEIKRLRTLGVGVLGGLVVGMTSVGSGSLMMLMLVLLYPRLRLRELVGTDLVQAVPLVLSAAIGHLFFGQFELGVTTSVVLGGIPGVYLGARLSARAPDQLIRPALVTVLLASALKLLGVASVTGVTLALLAGAIVFVAFRRAPGAAPDVLQTKPEPAPLPDPAE